MSAVPPKKMPKISEPGLAQPKQEYKYMRRIQKEVMDLRTKPQPPGIYTASDDQDVTVVHALIVGPPGTPYAGGFFYFLMKCQPDYPFTPPRVSLLTTDAGKVRFNPNLYNCGKVCLSILGTWAGPSWSAAQSLASVLLSIQTLMNEKPYHNEPGCEREHYAGTVQNYSDIIQHETLRVAVCGMMENECRLNIPADLVRMMNTRFMEMYDTYLDTIEKVTKLSGKPFQDPFGQQRGTFNYTLTLERLKKLRKTVPQVVPHAQAGETAPDRPAKRHLSQ